MCIRDRKEHNQTEEFIGMPNHKNLEQSNKQQEVEIIKVKQQKKISEQPKKVTCQDVMDFMAEQSRKQKEELNKKFEENSEKIDSIKENTSELLRQTINENNEADVQLSLIHI